MVVDSGHTEVHQARKVPALTGLTVSQESIWYHVHRTTEINDYNLHPEPVDGSRGLG